MNKKLLAIAISSALAAPMAAQAIEASVSGHVNRALPSSMTVRLLTGAALTAWHLSRVCASSAPAIWAWAA